MIYSIDYMEMMDQIMPLSFTKYLQDTGWKWLKRARNDIKIYQIISDKEEFFQVNIPLDRNLGDYRQAMHMAVETVAKMEQKPFEQVLLNLLNPNSDILKIRINKDGIEPGNIMLDDAIRLFDNTKKLIVAAAQDIIRPSHSHYGRQDDLVANFINQCRFGQTEIGSYVATVVCPFAQEDEQGLKQLSMFSEEELLANSLTRRVTKRIIDNIATIKSSISQGDLKKLEEDVEKKHVSTNFYSALAKINSGVDVEYIAQWSPSVRINRSQYSSISLSKDYSEPLHAVVQKYKNNVDEMEKYVGQIKQLDSAPDLSLRKEGTVKLVCLVAGSLKTITVKLDKTDYDTAIEAHRTGAYVKVAVISKANKKYKECQAFQIIESDREEC